MSTPGVIVVELYRCAPGRRGSRGQRWRWRAKDAGNNEILAKASEAYTNKRDALDAIVQLFSEGPRVRLTQPDEPDVILREMVEGD